MSAGVSEPEPAEYYKPYIDDHYTVLDGFDIAKSKSIWIALVAVDGGRGKDIRFKIREFLKYIATFQISKLF